MAGNETNPENQREPEVVVTAKRNAEAEFDSSVDSFVARFAKWGEFSRTNFFNVEINPPQKLQDALKISSQDLSFQCEGADLPGKNIDVMTVRHNVFLDRIPIDVVYPEVALTFICRSDLMEKKLFDMWMDLMIPSIDDIKYGLVRYRINEEDVFDSYCADVKIHQRYQLNTKIPASTIRLVDAIPLTMSSMPLNWSDDSVHKLTVTFAYRRWEDLTVDYTGGQSYEDIRSDIPSAMRGSSLVDKLDKVVSVAHAAKVLKKTFF